MPIPDRVRHNHFRHIKVASFVVHTQVVEQQMDEIVEFELDASYEFGAVIAERTDKYVEPGENYFLSCGILGMMCSVLPIAAIEWIL